MECLFDFQVGEGKRGKEWGKRQRQRERKKRARERCCEASELPFLGRMKRKRKPDLSQGANSKAPSFKLQTSSITLHVLR